VHVECAIGLNILANKKLTKKNRSRKMTLLLSTTDKDLQMLRDRQDKFGKDARKEIKRRKMVGFWDGTNAIEIDAKAEIEEPKVEPEEREYADGVRRI
jgi:hypothetical protein